MALKKSFTDKAGHVDANAYHRVHSVKNNREMAEILVYTYKDEASASDEEKFVVTRSYNCRNYTDDEGVAITDWDDYLKPTAIDPAGKNDKSQAYQYLKDKEPDFDGAVDV